MTPSPQASPDARFSSVQLQARDGQVLGARTYPADGPEQARLIVAGATGVPQAFYRRFAEFAAARGFATMTLDYRGIGASRPPSLRGFRMNYLDWARLDLAAAIEAWHRPDRPLFYVGHSFGGHAVGLLPEPQRLQKVYLLATGAGWHGWMPPLERLRVLAMWKVIGPLLTRWKGYLPWSLLGMGEDLPLSVYQQWRHWCSYPRYFFDDPAMAGVADEFARVQLPILAVNAIDDLWAPPRSRDAFMAGYRQASWQPVDLDPRQIGMQAIGHMGYFRPAAQPLWADMLAWFTPGGEALHAARPATV